MRSRAFLLGALAGLLAVAPVHAEPEPIEIRVATLAPHGSAWANILEKGNAQLREGTQGRVSLRIYFGGQQGDERDVVRKMKLGQLDGAALNAVGLGLIRPDVLVLQLPFLFSRDAEIDHVRATLGPELARQFDDAGYTLVSWGDVGWSHTYTTVEVKSREELAALRVWQWADDPIVREYFTVLGVNGVPLGVPEVLSALQTGSIQACYGPPLAAIALQWYTKIKYMTDRPSGYGIGAFVIRKDVLERLSPADRKVLLDGGRQTGALLTARIRHDNQRAKAAMLKSGVKLVHISDEAHAQMVAAGKIVWQRLAGKLYSKELLDKVVETIGKTP